ncbi:MAG: twin-arginine translocation signal domain-containing protein, partial [Verrucomicrobiales bacterium]|nr:twin-arginine translocation signal domain-containing protein [Verrucomicrobiales bacterium]
MKIGDTFLVSSQRMNSSAVPSRRQFIKTAAASVATFNIVPRHVLGGP